MLGKIKDMLAGKKEKPKRRRSLFGDVSVEEEEKIWKEITRKATEDQERVIRQAEEKRSKGL